jgi:thioredoxin 1
MNYANTELRRAEVDALAGAALIEFGSNECGHCRAAQPLLAEALAAHGPLRLLKVEDGKGRRLGRTFQVKLWPTLIFLRDGREVARLVRPENADVIKRALANIVS